MLIPVQVNAELFSVRERTSVRLIAAIVSLNSELREHFSRGAEVVGIPAAGADNLTKVEERMLESGAEVVVATVVFALRNTTSQDALHAVNTFSSTQFPDTAITAASEDQLDRLRGLSAFAGVASLAHDNAPARISDIAQD
jgi:hypothetical protein